jgi:hypothetical protein
MKFVLVLWVCSFFGGATNCFPPVEFPTLHDSWYECSRDAHIQSMKVLSTLGFKQVNDARMGTKYNCRLVPTY